MTVDAVIPAYLGWGNPERDKVGMRLYATDHEPATAGRWDAQFPGGRVIEYAAVERFGHAEGDRFLLVHVGNRFTPDETMQRIAEAVTAGSGDARIVDELRKVWPLLRGCAHEFDPECARCEWLLPLTGALADGETSDVQP